ncbi:MAG: HNH endonuclease [Pseudonocardiaceae bacterium]
MVRGGPGRQGSRWRRVQAQCLADAALYAAPCFLCGLRIDYSLYYLHRWAATVHHIVGLADGGDPLDPANLAPAHRSCNCRDGAHRRQHPELYRRPAAANSRRW